MAKKTRSRKQKAATRKLVRFNKRKAKKKGGSRRKPRSKAKSSRKKRKVNKPKRPKNKKKMAGKSGKKLIDKVPILKNKTVQRIGFGLGMGVIAVGIIDLAARFGPPALVGPLVQNKQIIKLGVEAVTEPISAVADVLLLGGGGGILGKLGGGGNGQQAISNGGFA